MLQQGDKQVTSTKTPSNNSRKRQVKTGLDRLISRDSGDETQFDIWRVLLIEMAHLVTTVIDKGDALRDRPAMEVVIDELLRNLHELAEMPDHPDEILIQHRGFEQTSGTAAKNDYRIVFNPLILDSQTASEVIRRLGIRMSYLAGRLGEAFGVFADLGIRSFAIRLPGQAQDSETELKLTLSVISKFFRSSLQAEFEVSVDGKIFKVDVIEFPQGRPDINLTLLAAVNSIGKDEMYRIISQVSGEMENFNLNSKSVYKAILSDNRLKAPLVELVCDIFGPTLSQNSDNLLTMLAGRLQLMSEMISAAEDRPDRSTDLPVLLDRIRQELERLGPDQLDSIDILKQRIRIRQAGQNLIVGLVNKRLVDLLEIVKEGMDTCRKISAIEAYGFSFSNSDCRDLARDFHMEQSQARDILNLLGSCYDANGRFLRSEFESKIDEFVKYEKKIFEFLWAFLKQTDNKEDRLDFLNALQKVIVRLNRPKSLLKFLLSDVCSNPEKVAYTDRNALMLANVLLRTYNKEIDIDIELTPEEVLLVRNGIDREVVGYAKWRLELDSARISTKISTVQKNIESKLCNKAETGPQRLHFLLALEREFIIFFSLVSGILSNRLLTDIAQYYGNPNNSIYRDGSGLRHIPEIMQQLKLAVRGLGRVGTENDLEMLNRLMRKTTEFKNIAGLESHFTEIDNTIEWIQKSVESINRRYKSAPQR